MKCNSEEKVRNGSCEFTIARKKSEMLVVTILTLCIVIASLYLAILRQKVRKVTLFYFLFSRINRLL